MALKVRRKIFVARTVAVILGFLRNICLTCRVLEKLGRKVNHEAMLCQARCLHVC